MRNERVGSEIKVKKNISDGSLSISDGFVKNRSSSFSDGSNLLATEGLKNQIHPLATDGSVGKALANKSGIPALSPLYF